MNKRRQKVIITFLLIIALFVQQLGFENLGAGKLGSTAKVWADVMGPGATDLSTVGAGNISISINKDPESLLNREGEGFKGEINYVIPNNMKDDSSPYQSFYKFPTENLTFSGATTGNIYDGLGVNIGTYELDNATGSVVFTYKDSYYESHFNIDGFFRFNANLKTDDLADKENVIFNFPGTDPFVFGLTPGKVTGGKSNGGIRYDGGKAYIDYTINLNADANVKDFKLYDTIGTNLKFVDGSFKVNDAASTPTIDGQKATFTIGNVSKGTCKITYTAEVVDLSQTDNLVNNADWTWDGGSGSADQNTFTVYGASVNKYGSNFGADDTKVKWTIQAKPGTFTSMSAMQNAKIEDTLPAGMFLTLNPGMIRGDMVIYDEANGYATVPASNYSVVLDYGKFSIQFNDTREVTNTPSYKIEYYTNTGFGPGPKPAENKEFLNKVVFTPKDGDPLEAEGYSHYYKPSIDNKVPGTVEKLPGEYTYDQDGNIVTEWTLNITPKSDLEEFKLTDYVNDNYNMGIPVILKDTVTVTYNGAPYEKWQFDPYNNAQASTIVVQFLDKLEKDAKITITYKSLTNAETYTQKIAYTGNIKNVASAEWKGGKDDVEATSPIIIRGGEVLKKVDKVTIYEGDKAVEAYLWNVMVNVKGQSFAIDLGVGPVTVKDTLPDGMKLYDGMWYYKLDENPYGAFNAYNYKSASSVPVSQNGNIITHEFNNIGKNILVIAYLTVIEDGYLGNKGDVTFTNYVEYSNEDGFIASGSASIDAKGEGLSKDGVLTSDGQQVVYTIDINPNMEDLDRNPETATITLVDSLPTNGNYVPNSFKVVTGADSVVSHRYSDGKLTVVVKDKAHVKIQYNVQPNRNIALDGAPEALTMTNKVAVKGCGDIFSGKTGTFMFAEINAGVKGTSGKITIQKIDVVDETKTLEGAKFKLQKMKYDAQTNSFEDDGAPVLVDTDPSGLATFSAEIAFDTLYYYQETQAPNGYKADLEKKYFYIKGNSTESWSKIIEEYPSAQDFSKKVGSTVLVSNEAEDGFDVTISKTDVAGEEIDGATIEINKYTDGSLVASWISGSDGKNADKFKPHTVKLEPGEYVLTETTAPEGYDVAESVIFKVDDDGKVYVLVEDKDKNTSDYVLKDTGVITIVDSYKKHEVTFSKTDVAGDEISGAEIKIVDKDGKTVESWTSGSDGQDDTTKKLKPHKFELDPGEYKLIETNKPNGYVIAEEIQFKIDLDGKVSIWTKNQQTGDYEYVEKADTVVTMVDGYEKHEVTISKTDVAGKEIAGAKLKVTDKLDKVVASWESGVDGLDADNNIISHKIYLEPGVYKLIEETAPNGYVEAEDIEFMVDIDGKVSIKVDNDFGDKNDAIITMVDDYKEHPISIAKTDFDSNILPGAELQLLKADGTVFKSWKSGQTTFTIELIPGTYTLHETNPPKGYKLADDITFKVDFDRTDGKTIVKIIEGKTEKPATGITMTDNYLEHEVSITKTDADGNVLPGAELEIKDSKGNVVKSWTSGKAAEVVKLIPGAYTLTETKEPDGYKKAASIEFTVDFDKASGDTVITINDKTVAGVTMVDEKIPTNTPTNTNTPTPTNTNTPTPTGTGTPTPTPTGTGTATPTPTGTGTATPTPTGTGTATPTPTGTGTPTPTPTGTGTPTPTPTGTGTPTPTPTGETPSPTPTGTGTPTPTPTGETPSPTPTGTGTPTPTPDGGSSSNTETPTPEGPSETPDVPSTTPDVPSTTPDVPSTTPDVPSTTPDVPSVTPVAPTATPDVKPPYTGDSSPIGKYALTGVLAAFIMVVSLVLKKREED